MRGPARLGAARARNVRRHDRRERDPSEPGRLAPPAPVDPTRRQRVPAMSVRAPVSSPLLPLPPRSCEVVPGGRVHAPATRGHAAGLRTTREEILAVIIIAVAVVGRDRPYVVVQVSFNVLTLIVLS